MLDFDIAPSAAPRIAQWLGVDGPTPADFEDIYTAAEAEGRYMTLYYMAIQQAKDLRIECPVLLHPALVGYEDAQVLLEYINGTTEQVWIVRSGGRIPCHMLTHRKNGIDLTRISPDAQIRNVQRISGFARIA